MQVRVFRGSAPTDGSQQIQRISPRRIGRSISPASLTAGPVGRLCVFTVQELELSRLEIRQDLFGIAPAGHVVTGELALALQRVTLRDSFTDQLSSERRPWLPLASGVSSEGPR